MNQKENRQRQRSRKGYASYYIPSDANPFPNFVKPYSPSVFDSISSGHGVISQGVGHTNAGRGLAKYGGGKKRSRSQRQRGGSSPSLTPSFSPASTDLTTNVSYHDPASGVSGFHPGFFDGVYSGHGTSSFTPAHTTAGLGLGKYDQIGYGHPSLWDYLNVDVHSPKKIEEDDLTVRFDNLYWFVGESGEPTFAMFEVSFSDGKEEWKGDGIIVNEYGKKIIRGRLSSCEAGTLVTVPLWGVLSKFFDNV